MLKNFLLVLTLLFSTAAFAAIDVNKASAAELDSIKGIGPALSSHILDARKSGNFKDWNDLMARVKGIGDKTAGKFSTDGLTVNGKAFTGAASASPKAKEDKTNKVSAAGAAPSAAASPAPTQPASKN